MSNLSDNKVLVEKIRVLKIVDKFGPPPLLENVISLEVFNHTD